MNERWISSCQKSSRDIVGSRWRGEKQVECGWTVFTGLSSLEKSSRFLLSLLQLVLFPEKAIKESQAET